jgi:hypothetical protein
MYSIAADGNSKAARKSAASGKYCGCGRNKSMTGGVSSNLELTSKR